MPDTTLPNTGAIIPEVGGSENTWGTKLLAAWTVLDGLFSATTGHDHAGAGKGAPIPSGGLKALATASNGIIRALGDGTFGLASAGAGISITAGVIAASITSLTAKTTPADADEFYLADSAASFALKKVTRANLLTGAVLPGTPYAHNAIGNASGAVALAANSYGSFALTATGNITFSITGAVSGKLYVIRVELTNGGAHTITHPAGTTHPGGIVPSLSPAGTDILFYASSDGGATWRLSAEIAHA